jgi:hypothetical protein
VVIFRPLKYTKYIKLRVKYIKYKIYKIISTIYIIQDCHGKSSIQEESFHQQIGLKFKKENSKVLHVEHSFFYGAETWTLRKADQKCLERFEMWCCRRMEISWTDCVRNEVLRGIKVERNILRKIKRRLIRLDTSGVGIAF